MQRRYVKECQPWPPTSAALIAELLEHARRVLKGACDDAVAAFETLGDPATTAGIAVHYPRLPDELLPKTDGKPNTESELFQWHKCNEDRETPQRLESVSAKRRRLKCMTTETPFMFFLYASIRQDQQEALLGDLVQLYPGRYFPVSKSALKDTADDYKQEILRAQQSGFICVHLGLDEWRQPWLVTTQNHNPIKPTYFKSGQAQPADVHRKFREKYCF